MVGIGRSATQARRNVDGMAHAREQATIVKASKVSENNPAERLIQVGNAVGTTHNQGKVLRLVKTGFVRGACTSERALTMRTHLTREIWIWGETKLEFMELEQELQHTTVKQIPVQRFANAACWMLFLFIGMIH